MALIRPIPSKETKIDPQFFNDGNASYVTSGSVSFGGDTYVELFFPNNSDLTITVSYSGGAGVPLTGLKKDNTTESLTNGNTYNLNDYTVIYKTARAGYASSFTINT